MKGSRYTEDILANLKVTVSDTNIVFTLLLCCCYTFQLKYVFFRLEESVSRVVTRVVINSLGKQQLELSTRAHRGRGKFVSQPTSSKRFLRKFCYFELWGITKHFA